MKNNEFLETGGKREMSVELSLVKSPDDDPNTRQLNEIFFTFLQLREGIQRKNSLELRPTHEEVTYVT